ncbi:unnamed protein product [Rotaria sp. Silwood2]|nr:unnamed protein product [Rotaria sp. Silwood2]
MIVFIVQHCDSLFHSITVQLRGTEIRLNLNSRWALSGITVAGGHGEDNRLNQLCNPFGLYVDVDQNIYVTDYNNHWIVEWKCGATSGQVIAGGHGAGNRMDQLDRPTDVIVDEATNNLFICDSGNRRIVRWPRRDGTHGETIMSNISCWGLTKDDRGYLYVSDEKENSVKRWRIGDTTDKIVAGGNGEGSRLDQLNHPSYIFVDQNYSVYVSDNRNHRAMKWKKDATEGIVVAGGRGQGNGLTHMNSPCGIVVDQLSTVYVAECSNHRVMRWPKGATQGIALVDGNSTRDPAKCLSYPWGLSFDRHGNLYVVDKDNQRVQKFTIDQSTC